jgi:hypothetical protein
VSSKQKSYWDEIREEIAAMEAEDGSSSEPRSPAAGLAKKLFSAERRVRLRRDNLTTILEEAVKRHGAYSVADLLADLTVHLREGNAEMAIEHFCDRLLPRLN